MLHYYSNPHCTCALRVNYIKTEHGIRILWAFESWNPHHICTMTNCWGTNNACCSEVQDVRPVVGQSRSTCTLLTIYGIVDQRIHNNSIEVNKAH